MKRAGETLTAILIAVLLHGVWLYFHDAKVKEAGKIDAAIEATHIAEVRIDSMKKTFDVALKASLGHSDTVIVAAKATTGTYDSLRARIDIPAQHALGVPVDSVVVSVAYVQAADSIAAAVPRLENALLQERQAASLRIAAGDSSVALLRTEIAQLRVAAQLSKPGITGKLKTAAVGGIIITAVYELVLKRH